MKEKADFKFSFWQNLRNVLRDIEDAHTGKEGGAREGGGEEAGQIVVSQSPLRTTVQNLESCTHQPLGIIWRKI